MAPEDRPTGAAGDAGGRRLGPHHLDPEAGNTLVLMPVAMLVLLALSAMALDTATVFLGQRHLVDVTSGVATDAVAAIDRPAFYAGDGELRLDPAQVTARADALIGAQASDGSLDDLVCDPPALDRVAATGDPRVTVTCRATVRPVLAPMWGLAEVHHLVVTESAVGVRN